MPDLPLCLGVFRHRLPPPLAKGEGHLPAKKNVYGGLLLMWCNFKFEGVLRFGAIPDIMIELIVYGRVPHSGPK